MVAVRQPGLTNLRALFPESDTANRIQRTFELMRVAEEEITAAKERVPRKKKTIHAAFGILCPGELTLYAEPLYRSHCRELIGRLVRKEDVRPGTDAEVLVLLSRTSLAAPLASQYAHAMSAIFFRVFPGADREFATGSEAWEGNLEEILSECRQKLARDR